MTQEGGAAWFGAGCPVDVDGLADRLPEAAVELTVHWPIESEQVMCFFSGFFPEAMEDKWRIVAWPMEGGLRVYFFRSWSGVLTYVLEVSEQAVRRIWAQAGDPMPEAMLGAIVDGYLLGKPCLVPAPPELGDDKLRLMLHGITWAGRRCDAVEPQNPALAL